LYQLKAFSQIKFYKNQKNFFYLVEIGSEKPDLTLRHKLFPFLEKFIKRMILAHFMVLFIEHQRFGETLHESLEDPFEERQDLICIGNREKIICKFKYRQYSDADLTPLTPRLKLSVRHKSVDNKLINK
jgi:hypothetical protein